MRKIAQILLILFAVFSSTTAFGDDDIIVIKNPVPKYHGISDLKKLARERSIEKLDDQDVNVFAGIHAAAVDITGNYYIYDFRHQTIIKVNQEFKFVKTIGRSGEGPGEFRNSGMTVNRLSIGRDDHLYFVNWLGKKIIKYTLDGKHVADFKFGEHFLDIGATADEKGNIYLPSLKGGLLDVHDSKMNYKKSLLSDKELKTFLFRRPPACFLQRHISPRYINLRLAWLSTNDLLLVNQFDLSITILDPQTGKVKNKFYAWDDFILSEGKKILSDLLEWVEKFNGCAFHHGFNALFLDNHDNIYLQTPDSQMIQYIYKFSRDGELIQIYQNPPGTYDEHVRFFHYDEKSNRFIGYSDCALHVYKIAD